MRREGLNHDVANCFTYTLQKVTAYNRTLEQQRVHFQSSHSCLQNECRDFLNLSLHSDKTTEENLLTVDVMTVSSNMHLQHSEQCLLRDSC